MNDESIEISAKTWIKTVDSIYKVRYSDGIIDGKNSAFQSSFNMGYEEGFQIAFKSSLMLKQLQHNCIICSDNDKLKENVINLNNLQKESNNEQLLRTIWEQNIQKL